MRVTAPAKINLTLRVLGVRPDGYHEIESVMVKVDLADTLTVEPADALEFTCSDPSLAGEDNLVMKAARLLQRETGVTFGARLHLEKVIPARAGLGGGSSDAAMVLRALAYVWDWRGTKYSAPVLAAQLGSDIPFFLNGPAAVARGRGEELTHVRVAAHLPIVLVKGAAGLSTPRVYTALNAPPVPTTLPLVPETARMTDALVSGDLSAVAAACVNDLEAPAFTLLPALAEQRVRMLELGCLTARLCGSGSALFGICANVETAAAVAARLKGEGFWTWAGETVSSTPSNLSPFTSHLSP